MRRGPGYRHRAKVQSIGGIIKSMVKGRLSVKGPLAVFDVDGTLFRRGLFRNVHYGYHSALRPVDRDALVESLEQDLHALQRQMRPLLDAVWNSVGAPGSQHYDESGNWR